MQFQSNSEGATMALGSLLARCVTWGQTVALYGDLGAGKTVLSRGFAKGMGVTEAVTSPTFTVVQEYKLSSSTYFFHLDMYRIENEASALAFGIEDFLYAPDAVTFVEWPERIEKLLPPEQTLVVSLVHLDHDLRKIILPDELGKRLVDLGLPEGISLITESNE